MIPGDTWCSSKPIVLFTAEELQQRAIQLKCDNAVYKTITVNGVEKTLRGKRLSYSRIRQLAYGKKDRRHLSITFFRREDNRSGMIGPGESVELVLNLRISAVNTGNA